MAGDEAEQDPGRQFAVGLDIVDFSSGVAPLGIKQAVSEINAAERAGFDRAWVPVLGGGPDPLVVCAAAAAHTRVIGLATGVMRTWAHHPVELARAAVSVAAVCGGGLTLGVGVSHRPLVESTYGLSWSRPAAHLREYLSVLATLLRRGEVDYHGEIWSAHAELDMTGAQPVRLAAAAGGPRMLAAAAAVADVVVTNMAGPWTLATHTVPALRRAERSDGVTPTLAVAVTVCVTDRPEVAAGFIDSTLAGYAENPDYRAMLDREGVRRPSDIAVVGDEDEVRRGLDQLIDAGVDEIIVSIKAPSDEEENRTRAFVAAKQ
ncbi:MAG TPA: LLM class flavin-dependent oxidoreductase [Acidimicrobiales bacterium]|nr:LLM class flavin-dependent oxidoreductase [Acidimicrobiales bacterium]